MDSRVVGVVLALLLVCSGCGGDDGGEQEDVEPTRCGGIHWSDSAGQDVYTGCQGNDTSWSCACESDPSEAFQDGGESADGATSCGQAVEQTCSRPVLTVSACAGGPGAIGTCWYAADGSGNVSQSTFDCRCEDGVATSEVNSTSCQAALYDACDTRTECSADGDTCSPGNEENKWICECADAGGSTDVVYSDSCEGARSQSCG
ncbi:MAG: hypothetical protein ACQEVA_10120 [Myxococcota bacterium]